MAPTIGRLDLDNGFHGSIPGDWVAPPPQNIQLQDMSWFDFLDQITEPELVQYLKERRLYVNEPVNTYDAMEEC